MVIERVRSSSEGGHYRDRRGKWRARRARWYTYWRVVDNGRIINTFLKKSTAAQWVRRQRT
jgi:hypothetical protein